MRTSTQLVWPANSHVMAAVDSPAPGGAQVGDLARLLAGLVDHPRALGMNLTIYDPHLDPTGSCARVLVELLGVALGDATRGTLASRKGAG